MITEIIKEISKHLSNKRKIQITETNIILEALNNITRKLIKHCQF